MHKDNNIITERGKRLQERHTVIQTSSSDENVHHYNNGITSVVIAKLLTKRNIQESEKQNTINQELNSNYNQKRKSNDVNLTVYRNKISLIRWGQINKYKKVKSKNNISKMNMVNLGEEIQMDHFFWSRKNRGTIFVHANKNSSGNRPQTAIVGGRNNNKSALHERIRVNSPHKYDKLQFNHLEDINQQEPERVQIKNTIQRIIRDTARKAVKRQAVKGKIEPTGEENPRKESDFGNSQQTESKTIAGENKVFGGVTTCPTCTDERTNYGCHLNGATQCSGEQMACHKTLMWDGPQSTMRITSKCDNYTSCLTDEAKNQNECGVDYQETDVKSCHFCCYGPTCTTTSIGGRTKDFTFDLSYIRNSAVYEPYMADKGNPSYLQEEERIDEGIRKAVSGLAGGVDVFLIRFVPHQNQQHEVVVKLYVTTFSFATEEAIREDIEAKIMFSLQETGSFFNGEDIVPESLKLSANNDDSHWCPGDTSSSTGKGNITWQTSPEGQVLMLCPYGNNNNSGSSNAVRACLRQPDGSVAWGEADYSSCSSKDDQEPVTVDKLFETPITTRNAKAVSAMLKTYTEAVENLTGEAVNNVVSKLEMLLQDSMLQQPDVVNNVVECLSFISSSQTFATFERRITLSQRLLNMIDFISEKTPLANGKLMLVTANFAIVAHGLNASEISDVALTVDADSTDGLLNNSKISVGLSSRSTSQLSGSSNIVVPTQAIVASLTPEERLTLERISFVVHQTDTLFATLQTIGCDAGKQTNETDFCQQNNSLTCQKESSHKFLTKINSQVISASVPGVRVTGLQENITMNFIHNANATNPRCVFWNTNTSSGSGEWSGEGCGVVKSDSRETTCGCNHLTNFALIMDVYQGGSRLSDLDRKILSIISYVGCGVSLMALILTLLTYTCFRKLRRDNPSKILINLCLALMLSNLVYIVGMQDYTFDNTASCKVVAVFLHYFLLASLTWMAVEAFYMYLALILVFKTYFTNFILKCCLVGWGVPFGIVVITLGVNSTDNYGIINSGLCWLRNPAFYAAFVGPVCLILLVNLLAFGLVMRQLVNISGSNLSKTDRNSTIHRLRGAVGVVVLLGLSWLFAIFAIGQASVAFYYLFAVFNSMQGLFIFIFYCLLKKDAVILWKRSLPCFEEYGETSKTSSNSRAVTAAAATHHMAKHDNHSRSESSTFLGNTVSVTSTLIDSRKNSCFSNGLNNNPYDSNEECETPLRPETPAAASEYKQRLPISSSEGKYNPDSTSQNLSLYQAPEMSSNQLKECENTRQDPYTERSCIDISSKSLDSSKSLHSSKSLDSSQLQPVLLNEGNGYTATSSEGLQRSFAADSPHVIREGSIELELPNSGWSYVSRKDNKSGPAISLASCNDGTNYSNDSKVTEKRLGNTKSGPDTTEIFVTHL